MTWRRFIHICFYYCQCLFRNVEETKLNFITETIEPRPPFWKVKPKCVPNGKFLNKFPVNLLKFFFPVGRSYLQYLSHLNFYIVCSKFILLKIGDSYNDTKNYIKINLVCLYWFVFKDEAARYASILGICLCSHPPCSGSRFN